MSDTNRIKELEAELKAAQDTILDQRVEITALRKTKPGSNRGKIVPGTFTAELESLEGETKKVKVKFQPGFVNCRLKGGFLVSSESLMKLANGKKLTDKELEKSPALEGYTKEKAVDWMTHLVRKGASFLIPA